ncbi:MAG: tyrosine-type recombinase/integrase [Ruminiclostridium sp.]
MAKKQPSGKWRASAYLGKDENGKRIYKTFTAPTKREAEYKAMMYKLEYEESAKNVDNPTMAEAFARYIESKSNVLSPATIRGYIRISRTELTGYHLSEKRVNDISNEDIQRAVNEYALNHSPKSVRNFHGLISAVLGVFRPSMKLTTSLPQRKRTKLYLPTDEDIKALLKATEGEEIEKAIMLAAFGSLRRSEIAALTGDDIDGNYITVSKAMVLNNDNEWVIKSPKTYAGYRTIEMPEFVIAKLPKKGPVTTLSPNKITQRFAAALKKSDCPHFRFHDLRHYQASILHAMGVPDKYIIARGGWRTEATLKNIYQHTMDKKRQEVETQICCRFTQMMQPECNKNEDKPHKKAI